jgi:hypothetical protein
MRIPGFFGTGSIGGGGSAGGVPRMTWGEIAGFRVVFGRAFLHPHMESSLPRVSLAPELVLFLRDLYVWGRHDPEIAADAFRALLSDGYSHTAHRTFLLRFRACS